MHSIQCVLQTKKQLGTYAEIENDLKYIYDFLSKIYKYFLILKYIKLD